MVNNSNYFASVTIVITALTSSLETSAIVLRRHSRGSVSYYGKYHRVNEFPFHRRQQPSRSASTFTHYPCDQCCTTRNHRNHSVSNNLMFHSRLSSNDSRATNDRPTILKFIRILGPKLAQAAYHIKKISFIPRVSSVFTTIALALTLWWATASSIQSSWAETTPTTSSARHNISQSSTLTSGSRKHNIPSKRIANAAIERQKFYNPNDDNIITIQSQYEPFSSSYHRRRRRVESDYRQIIIEDKRRSQYPIDKRKRIQQTGRINNHKHFMEVNRISLLVLSATLAASTYRAKKLRTASGGGGGAKSIRSITPFGIIRNQSLLGNGVSIIRVNIACEFAPSSNGHEGVSYSNDQDAFVTLLKRLRLEEKEVYTRMSMLNKLYQKTNDHHQSRSQKDNAGNRMNTYTQKQKALVDYTSNVASILLPYQKFFRYGSLTSMRVPFVEEAVQEFQQMTKKDRALHENIRYQLMERNQIKSQENHERFLVATILLCIKGDRTTIINCPMFGILRQRDMARALLRIAIDAKTADCFIASEIMMVPDTQSLSTITEDEKRNNRHGPSHSQAWRTLLSETEVLNAFPDLIPLT